MARNLVDAFAQPFALFDQLDSNCHHSGAAFDDDPVDEDYITDSGLYGNRALPLGLHIIDTLRMSVSGKASNRRRKECRPGSPVVKNSKDN